MGEKDRESSCVLEIKDLTVTSGKKKEKRWILDQISLRFEKGRMYAFAGSGSRVLLSVLAGLEQFSSGSVIYRQVPVYKIGGSMYRRSYVSLLFGDNNLLPYYSVFQNVWEAVRIGTNKDKPSKKEVYDLLESFGIDRGTAVLRPAELSAEQRWAAAAARAAASGTEVILVEEPAGLTDGRTARKCMQRLKMIAVREQKCVIVAARTIEALKQADEVYELKNGVLLCPGEEESETHKEVRRRRRQRYLNGFIHEKNSPLIYGILFKNFKSNWRSFLQFFSCAVLSVALVFSAFSIQQMLKGFDSRVDADILHDGMSGIVTSALVVILVLTLFLMLFSLQNYVRSRMRDYGIFRMIGISDKTMGFMMGIEYAGSLAVSFLIGLLIGNAAVLTFRQILARNYPGGVRIPFPSVGTYGVTLLVSAGIFLSAFIVSQEYFVEAELAKTVQQAVRREKRPKKLIKTQLVIGVIVSVIAVVCYASRGTGELWYFLAAFLVGIYLAAKSAGALLLNWVRGREKYYYRHVLSLNQFYHRFRSNAKSMLFLFVLQFLMLFYLPMQVIPMLPMDVEAQFPHDYMMWCEKEEDLQFLEELKTEFKVTYTEFPAVRVNVNKGSSSPMDYRKIWNQGENLGISESTSLKIQGKESEERKLKGKEIYIIFQEDKSQKAHPLDWNMYSNQPAIRIGRADNYDPIFDSERFSLDYPFKGHERRLDTGAFGEGMHENLVVFSDAYFDEIYEGARTALIDVPKEHAGEVEARLGAYEKEHLEPHNFNPRIKTLYRKTEAVQSKKAENFLILAINGFFFLAFIFSNFFIAYQKLCSDIPYQQKKHELLGCVGMKLKEQKSLLGKEIFTFWTVPLLAALACAVLFTGLTLRMRFYTVQELLLYLKFALPYTAVFLVVQGIGILWMRRFLVKAVMK